MFEEKLKVHSYLQSLCVRFHIDYTIVAKFFVEL